MENKELFTSQNGIIDKKLMLEKLKEVEADKCDVLYIHTDMTFGLPVKGIKRNELLASLLDVIETLNVRTLVFPTFTFSFCNNEVYDVENSKTSMGALNEYVRKTNKGTRTADPLLSVYVIGDHLNLVDDLGIYSIGKDSNYDRIHTCKKDVRFLFFGAAMSACFTYTHYMEAILNSPYRYDRLFRGTIIKNGVEYKNEERCLYTTYANCRLNMNPVVEDAMRAKNQLNISPIGDTSFCCFKEKDAYNTIVELLEQDPLCLTDGKYDNSIKDTSYDLSSTIVSVK